MNIHRAETGMWGADAPEPDPVADVRALQEEMKEAEYPGPLKYPCQKNSMEAVMLKGDVNVDVIELGEPVVYVDVVNDASIADPVSFWDFMVRALIEQGCIFGPNAPGWDHGRCDA